MNYEYLMTIGNKRYYKFSEPISVDVNGDELRRGSTQYVVVSDAHTHEERLVFPVYIADGYSEEDLLNKVKGSIEFDFIHIAGEVVMIGGDVETMKPDEYYLNELIEANTTIIN